MVFCCCFATEVYGGGGKLTGFVFDETSGGPVAGANLSLEPGHQRVTSDVRGRFLLLNLAPGVHDLKVSHVGYRTVRIKALRISGDLTTELVIRLQTAEIQVEEVVVVADRSLADRNATNAVRILAREEIDKLPLRGVSRIVSLQPGVVAQDGTLHIRGSRGDEVGAYIAGSSVRNAVTGILGVSLIDEALSEIQLQAGGFTAEYGGANAGILLQEIRRGGPEWNFQLLSETDRFGGNRTRRFGAYSYGYSNQVLTGGGPLGDDRFRAFVAVQRHRLDARPVFWDGFKLGHLADSGNRGGRVHWVDRDGDGVADPDSATVRVPSGIVPHTATENINLNTALVFDRHPFQLRLTAVAASGEEELNPRPVASLFNQRRLPEAKTDTRLLNLRATHLLDNTTYYELNLSRFNQRRKVFDPVFEDDFIVYGDSVAASRVDPAWQYSSQGVSPRPYDLYGFPFDRPGAESYAGPGFLPVPVSGYDKERDSYSGLSGSFVKQVGRHQARLGFDYQRWTSRRYSIFLLGSIRGAIRASYPHLETAFQRFYDGEIKQSQVLDDLIRTARGASPGNGNLDDLTELVRRTSAADFYGYDAFGREGDGGGLDGARRPVFASAFLQDKVEYDDLVINAGLRWDYFDVDSWRFVDPSAPVRNDSSFAVEVSSMRKTRTFHEFSPRLGFSFPVTAATDFHVQYGRFVQMPALRDMFTGGARLALELGGGQPVFAPTAFDVAPVRTTQYEVGIEHLLVSFAAVNATGFYRDVRGQLQARKQELSASAQGARAYNFLQNGDFATTSGVELGFDLKRTKRLEAHINYTLSSARGTGSVSTSAVSAVENKSVLPTVVSPLTFNQTHRGNLDLDYRFGREDGGVLARSGINVLIEFSSGHNFTRSTGSVGQRGPESGAILADDDPRNRLPEEPVNSSSTPWTFETSLRVDRGFTLFGGDVEAFVYVQNLFNRKNVFNVYERTGNAEDDGFLTNPELSGQLVEANGGDRYRELYEAINLANRQHYWNAAGKEIYGPPRQVRVGLRVGF